MKTHVRVLTTGGTIASQPDATGQSLTSSVSGQALLQRTTSLEPDLPATTVEEFANIGSYAMDLETSFRLASRINTLLDDPLVEGVVVTHGTDTMEESAYLSDLVVRSDKPVVFTGAQRHALERDTDGLRNLSDAIRAAAAPACRGIGTVIAFGGEIHAARDVTKAHSSRLNAFESVEHGKLGLVDANRIILHRRPVLRSWLHTERIEPSVDMIRLVMGCDGRFLRFAVEHGARGIVLEAFGRGNVTPGVLDGITEAIRAGVSVVVTSRCPQGRVLPLYGGSGGAAVAATGAVFAGNLAGPKARILLALLLGGRMDVGRHFDSLGG